MFVWKKPSSFVFIFCRESTICICLELFWGFLVYFILVYSFAYLVPKSYCSKCHHLLHGFGIQSKKLLPEYWHLKTILRLSVCTCACIRTDTCVGVNMACKWRSEGTPWSCFSPSTFWVLGIELWSSGLNGNHFHWQSHLIGSFPYGYFYFQN